MAAAKEASKLGMTVGLADYVKPSPMGTKWGLGGTCVNVGCIPKKLMHFASSFGELKNDYKECGWQFSEAKHNWEEMVQHVNSHIKSLNWGYKTALNKEGVKYYNANAVIKDKNTIELTNERNEKTIVAV